MSRFVIVWGIDYPFPQLAQSPFYTSMLLAWSTTEVVRYAYFALNLCGVQYGPYTWLRYSTFLVLYPIGIASECRMILLAIEPSKEIHELAPWVLYAILAIYVPGTYILYGHMLKQRKKVLAKQKAERDEKSK